MMSALYAIYKCMAYISPRLTRTILDKTRDGGWFPRGRSYFFLCLCPKDPNASGKRPIAQASPLAKLASPPGIVRLHRDSVCGNGSLTVDLLGLARPPAA